MTLPPRGASRMRPAFRRVAIVCFAMLVPVALWNLWDYVELRRLIGELERIRERGEPLTAREAGWQTDPSPFDADSAGVYFEAGSILALGGSRAPNVDGWLAGANTESLEELEERLRRMVERHSEALRLVDEGLTREFRGFSAGNEFSYRTWGVTSIAWLMSARSVGVSLAGEGDAAVQVVLDQLRYGSLVEAGEARLAFFGEPRHEIAGVLSFSRPSPASLRRLQSALESLEDPERELDNLLRSRAELVERIWRRYYGLDPQVPLTYRLPWRSVTESLLRPWFTHDFVRSLRLWSELIGAARLPWPERMRARQDVERRFPREPRSLPGSDPPTRWRPVWYEVSSDVPDSSFHLFTNPQRVVKDRASRMAVAVERYRRDHDDALPSSLSDLVPAYVGEVSLDPISGEPLRYRVDAESYSIYSVGVNGVDDGGNLRASYWGPSDQADVGVRVLRVPPRPAP